ncbi:MAG: hypothetical protein C4538_08130 [Nitrospiraceae bacterium]|nr:MAG: hypothetical protein C4538_08130 [Nitrospiraceae bacterium]
MPIILPSFLHKKLQKECPIEFFHAGRQKGLNSVRFIDTYSISSSSAKDNRKDLRRKAVCS